MAPTRHVSQWRLCRRPEPSSSSENSSTCLPNKSQAIAKDSSSLPPVSLRYLNEFVGKLHCASALLEHELFPDAKEITESMGLFNAVRRYIQPKNIQNHVETHDKHDGIVVVGDGNTPRTAAMFAFRMQGWTSYSVDPAMESGTSERSKGWEKVSNLVVMRNKIEHVRIVLRRAIVVLVHAHVTLDQALSAVQAEEVCGVVTLPCCNWYGQQESIFGRGPDLVYDDFSVLSDHREIRLWVGDGTSLGRSNVNASHGDMSLTLGAMKGCVRKEFIVDPNGFGTSFDKDLDPQKQADALQKKHDGVLDFIRDTLAELTCDTSLLSQEKCMAEEQTIDNSLPSAVMSNLRMDSHVLVLDWHPRRSAMRLLLRDGYTDVYTLSLAGDLSFSVDDSGTLGTKVLQLQLYKGTSTEGIESRNAESGDEENMQLKPCGYFTLQSSFALSSAYKYDNESEETVHVSFCHVGYPVPPLACVLDVGFIFYGFRGRAKRPATFFRQLYRTLDEFVVACGNAAKNNPGPSLICLTPRKQWRKKTFLAHVDLNYDVLSLFATKDQTRETPMYVYCCFKRPTVSDSKRLTCCS
ncbi:unnamed protein product [Peronospora belbahrii]|uniref:Uncharacterized protein n=1 Tax=Peronospora belbahrii TaxID=622444 RepID=A0ABN8CP12_9STRA|nr:unnamed protein product [Peronospora belbahrii]